MDQAAGYGTLLIDAGNIVAGVESSTLIGPLATNATGGTVNVTNSGKWRFPPRGMLIMLQ